MINFLYCFDKNYLQQAKTSISSLLRNVSEKITIHIICDSKKSSSEIFNIFKEHPKIEDIKTYHIQADDYTFPKVDGSHVSNATYFRMFIDRFLPEDLKQVVYLDADVICMKDPIIQLKTVSKELANSGFGLAALTEATRKEAPIIFNKLKLNHDNYFNAGVVMINYEFWKKNSVGNSLIDIMENRGDDLIFWDQDVLNIFFDDEYIKFSNTLNYNFTQLDKINNNEIVFLHYAGKGKPWDVENIVKTFSRPYQKEYSKLGIQTYHVVFKRNKKTIKSFIKVLFKLQFMNLEKPFTYIALSLKSFIKNEN